MGNNIELFDGWAKSFDADIAASDGSFPFAGYQKVVQRITDLAAARNPGTVLDLDCGRGVLLHNIADAVPTASLTGVDFSSGMLERVKRAAPAASLIEADIAGDLTIQALPRFDAIVASYLLHESPDEQKADLIAAMSNDLLTPDEIRTMLRERILRSAWD